MRHRAPRRSPFLIVAPLLRRRGALAGAVMALTGALTGVGMALQQDGGIPAPAGLAGTPQQAASASSDGRTRKPADDKADPVRAGSAEARPQVEASMRASADQEPRSAPPDRPSPSDPPPPPSTTPEPDPSPSPSPNPPPSEEPSPSPNDPPLPTPGPLPGALRPVSPELPSLPLSPPTGDGDALPLP